MISGGTEAPGTSLCMNSALAKLHSGQMPPRMGTFKSGRSLKEDLKGPDIENRLGDGELRPCFDLLFESGDLVVQVDGAGVDAYAYEKRGRLGHGLAADIDALIETA